jgi:hypothetical protein
VTIHQGCRRVSTIQYIPIYIYLIGSGTWKYQALIFKVMGRGTSRKEGEADYRLFLDVNLMGASHENS